MKSLTLFDYLKKRKRKILNNLGAEDGKVTSFFYRPTKIIGREKKQTFFTVEKNFKIKPAKKEKKQKKTPTKLDFSLANSFNIGYYLITPLLIGVFFGLLLDNFLKTKPVFTLTLLSFGMMGTLYNLWKLIKEIE